MIKMFEANKVVIAPELKVKDLQAKDMELDEIIEYALNKGYDIDDILYEADAFQPVFLDMLQNDKAVLERLNKDWELEEEEIFLLTL